MYGLTILLAFQIHFGFLLPLEASCLNCLCWKEFHVVKILRTAIFFQFPWKLSAATTKSQVTFRALFAAFPMATLSKCVISKIIMASWGEITRSNTKSFATKISSKGRTNYASTWHNDSFRECNSHIAQNADWKGHDWGVSIDNYKATSSGCESPGKSFVSF